jgi:hypothetical protein
MYGPLFYNPTRVNFTTLLLTCRNADQCVKNIKIPWYTQRRRLHIAQIRFISKHLRISGITVSKLFDPEMLPAHWSRVESPRLSRNVITSWDPPLIVRICENEQVPV